MRPWRACGAWGRTAAVTVRADAGFFSYEMIAAIGAHEASYSITIPQNAKVKASRGGHRRRRLGADRLHPRPRGPRWLRPPSSPAAAATRSAAATASGPSCGSSCAAAACSAPKASCGPTGATTASSSTETTSTPVPPTPTTEPTPPSSSPSETSKRTPGSAAAPQDGSSPTAPGSPAACSRTTSCAGPPRLGGAHPTAQLTVAATIRNRLLTVPGRLVNHSGRRKLRLPTAIGRISARQRRRRVVLLDPPTRADITPLLGHPRPGPTRHRRLDRHLVQQKTAPLHQQHDQPNRLRTSQRQPKPTLHDSGGSSVP